jgi:hypothetical protein
MEKNNEHTRRLNEMVRQTGAQMSVPVFPWDKIFYEQLESNIFDGWCHQWWGLYKLNPVDPQLESA